jgi:hypothetical protein
MSRTIAALLALTATLALSLLAVSPAIAGNRDSALRLHVGAGITATIATASMHFSCSDDADCKFDIPANSTLDVVARGPRGDALRWTGCSSQPEAGRCRVEIQGQPVLVTVR